MDKPPSERPPIALPGVRKGREGKENETAESTKGSLGSPLIGCVLYFYYLATVIVVLSLSVASSLSVIPSGTKGKRIFLVTDTAIAIAKTPAMIQPAHRATSR